MRRSKQFLENQRRRIGDHASHARSSDQFGAADSQALQGSMVGTVVLASDADYDQSRMGFLRNHESLPQMICYCEVPQDVVLALEFATRHQLTPVCRSGGHSTAGYSVNDELVIDLSRINYVVVDEAAQTARVGAGTNFEKLEAVLAPHRLHVPSGGCPSVAVAGYMQGGGYSFTSRMFGMNCDSVKECTVVTADGTIVRANATEHQDLFWALRGGTGNNFGVLLEIVYDLHEVNELWGFGLRWELSTADQRRQAAAALEVWQANFTGGDESSAIGTELFIVDLSRDGRPAAAELLVRGMYRGSEEQCRTALEPLTQLCPDGGHHDIWCSGTYRDVNETLMNTPLPFPDVPPNVRAAIESRIVDVPLSANDWLALLERFPGTASGSTMIAIESYGGAINRPQPSDTAFVHRRAHMDVFIWSFWMYQDEQEAAHQDLVDFRAIMDPLSNGHAYQNYPNRDTPRADYPTLYWGDNYPRLQQVKATYDPDTLFRFPQMIHPPGAE